MLVRGSQVCLRCAQVRLRGLNVNLCAAQTYLREVRRCLRIALRKLSCKICTK